MGNTNSSSREKKISNLFEEGCAFDRHSDDVNALFKFRKVIELEPLHANSNYCIGRLLAHKFIQGHFISSGSFSQIVEHFRIADRGGCKQAKAGLFKFLVNGENGNLRPHPDHFKEIVGYFKSLAAQAEAETSPDQLSLFAASLAHITYGQVLMICSTEEDHVAAHVLAESELRMAVEQNPRS